MADPCREWETSKTRSLWTGFWEQGLAIAQGKLGAMYYLGEDVAQDYQEAAKWFRLAATQGNAKAQFNLGGMYYEGKGLPKDYVLAQTGHVFRTQSGMTRRSFWLLKKHSIRNRY